MRTLPMFAIAALLVAAAAAQHQGGGEATFAAPQLPTVTHPIRVTFFGANFSEGTLFRLSDNATTCNAETLYTLGDTPPGTVSNVVTWTVNHPSTFVVAEFTVDNPHAPAYACYSRDGRKWVAAANHRGRKHFHSWRKVPTITEVSPLTITVGTPARFVVPNLPLASRAALVNMPGGCDAVKPENAIEGGNSSTYSAGAFVFHVRRAAPKAWLCVATGPSFVDWTLVPYDPHALMVFRGDSSEPVTQRLSDQSWVTINPHAIVHDSGVVACTPVVAGASVTCTVQVVNKTALTLAAQDFVLVALHDGAGAAECPLPAFAAVSGSPTEVAFTFTPQRSGRGGFMMATYKGHPLLFADNANNQAFYNLPNGTKTVHTAATVDPSMSRFIVLPGYAQLHSYAAASLTHVSQFAPLTNWDFGRGLLGHPHNATLGDEVEAITLKSGTTVGTVTQTVAIPAGATMCKFRANYLFSAAGGVDLTTTSYIGKIALVLLTGAGADIAAHSTFHLYAHGSTIVVTGGPRTNGMDGDMNSWESVGAEFNVLSAYGQVRLELEAYEALQSKLYFSEAAFRCSSAVSTPPAEVLALKRIWNTVGAASTRMLRWRDAVTADFNGDPCINHWAGVVCRNLRVVELNLASSLLVGTFPKVWELKMLERLILKDNALTGILEIGNVRLTHVDVSSNKITGFSHKSFNATDAVCLRTLIARHNEVDPFPAHVLNGTALQQLDLSFNRMQSEMPDVAATSVLRQIDVSHNKLFGALPALPTHYAITLDFSANGFSGEIPRQWGDLQQAELLDVSKNALTGAVPGELSRVVSASRLTFRAEENYLSGLLPLLQLRRVDVRDNAFKCPLPAESDLITHTRYISHCDYSQV
jgi:hypothetical protein